MPHPKQTAATIYARCVELPWSGCWIWMGRLNKGYPKLSFENKTCGGHRVLYEMLIGPIPEGLTLDHLCKIPCCVNPAHLEPVTLSVNMKRADRTGMGGYAQRKRTKCIHGHLFNDENTYWDKHGYRSCKTCQRERERRYYQKRRVQEAGEVPAPAPTTGDEKHG